MSDEEQHIAQLAEISKNLHSIHDDLMKMAEMMLKVLEKPPPVPNPYLAGGFKRLNGDIYAPRAGLPHGNDTRGHLRPPSKR